MTPIQQNILALNKKIREYEIRYHRPPYSVGLLAVSKMQSVNSIQQAVQIGQIAFGENYLQESVEKMNQLADENLQWHFIGAIQNNKTQKIAEHFSWVQSVSHLKTAQRLSAQRPMHLPPLNICLQVKLGTEQNKTGASPQEISALAEACACLPNLVLRGLMAIPAAKKIFAEQRAELQQMRALYEDLQKQGHAIDTLSMGMSNDMEAAIAEGATLLRIGTAIFGQRIEERRSFFIE